MYIIMYIFMYKQHHHPLHPTNDLSLRTRVKTAHDKGGGLCRDDMGDSEDQER